MTPSPQDERSHSQLGKNVCRSVNFYVVRGGHGSRTATLEPPAETLAPKRTTERSPHRVSRASDVVQARRVPRQPIEYRFATRCGAAGLRNLLGAVGASALGAFLFAQIASTPDLRLQIAGVATFCCGLGLYLLPDAIRNLFGRLRLDASGIRATPGFLGFDIPWSELARWQVDAETFRFRSTKSRRTFTTPHAVLGPDQRQELRALLAECAGDREDPARESGAASRG